MLCIQDIMFTFVNANRKPIKTAINSLMKDRIKEIMESQHMNQNVFAQFVGLSPATLSGIFTGRTRPTINIIESIKKRMPTINIDWLMFGTGDMYVHNQASNDEGQSRQPSNYAEPMLAFDEVADDVQNRYVDETIGDDLQTSSMAPVASQVAPVANQMPPRHHTTTRQSMVNIRPGIAREEVKIIEKQRKITEIRIYFDDLTYETFVPSQSK